MQAFDHGQRNLHRQPAAVCQVGPGCFVVRLDRGPILGKRQLEANVAVRVAVGHVVDHLAQCPAALTVRGIELRVAQPGYRCPQPPGQHLQRMNMRRPHAGQAAARWIEAPNGITKVVQIAHGPHPISPHPRCLCARAQQNTTRPQQELLRGRVKVLGVRVVVMVMAMMVTGGRKNRAREHHQQKGCRKNLLHAPTLALLRLSRQTI